MTEILEFRRARDADAEAIAARITARWDRAVSADEVLRRIAHGIEWIAVNGAAVVGQMSCIITDDFKPSWCAHVGCGDAGTIEQRASPTGSIATLYQLTVAEGSAPRIAERLRECQIETVAARFRGMTDQYTIRTHSPIQDLGVVVETPAFSAHIRKTCGVAVHADTFFTLPADLQVAVARERLAWTLPRPDPLPLSAFARICADRGLDPACAQILYDEHRNPSSAAFDMFVETRAARCVPAGVRAFFGIEEYLALTRRYGERTLHFHAGGGARIDALYAGGSAERRRSLGVAVSYRYPVAAPVEQGRIGRMVVGE